MDHPRLGNLRLTQDAFGWVAEITGLDGKVIAHADTLRELRKKLEKR